MSSKKPKRTETFPEAILLFKKVCFFLFGLSLFFLPSNNWVLRSFNLKEVLASRVLGSEVLTLYDYPEFIGKDLPLNVSAESFILVDKDSGVILLAKNENEKLLPASTVKIMTALVSLKHYSLSDVLMVRNSYPNGQDVGFEKGELVSVEDLLYALLVSSANDAAEILANHYPGGEKAFVSRMNEKAIELNLTNTHFANPTGLDSDENEKLLSDFSYSTAKDLANLSRVALLDDNFSKIVSTPYKNIKDVKRGSNHPLYNINELLGRLEGVRGIKTGWTEEAGECFVGFTQRNGRGIISVVLKSNDRFGETKQLVNWAFENFSWHSLESATEGK